MTSNSNTVWTPSFWMQGWTYQSFLILPTDPEKQSPPGTSITTKKWAKGNLYLETSIDPPPAPDAIGSLVIPTPPGNVKLNVKAFVERGISPVKFEATGEVQNAPTETSAETNGAMYKLLGWAFRSENDKVSKIEGCVIAVRGSDARPNVELGGMPVGTVGAFIITST
ncbi:hypothetical protein [Nostoc sp. WHI]|uniref:hypothetical protein n=1 Tax=Nostoc sp. WHI TaxID=2650611 RepID=UPI0018C779FD|nr:hypothetical protein [Nostoc sp. WHI]MBG1270415.1 hypothetical protein [Nostoc sp. WHI]